MIKVVTSTTLLALALLAETASAQVLKLSPLTTFGTNADGAIRPNTVDFLNSSGQLQRGMAWNPVTGHVLVACRTNAAFPATERVLVLDGTTGDLVAPTNMDMSSLALGGNASFVINLIGVADDGAVYVGNLSNQQIPAQFHLYRWSNENDFQNLVYYSDFDSSFSDAVNRRWGDTLAVRGSGVNTEVLIASRGTNVAILRPTDSSMSTFYATILRTDTPTGDLGYGIAFGSANTFWGTSGANGNGPLYYMSYDVNAGTATTLNVWSATNFPATVSQLNFLPGSNWLAGLDTRAGADFVRIYSVTNLAGPPSLQDRATWVTNNNNATFSGAVVLTTNNILYALDGDNGLMAFSVGSASTNPLPPSITLQPAGRTAVIGSNVTLNAAADGDLPLSYQWQFKASTNGSTTVDIPAANGLSLALSNVQLTNSGSYTFIASNSLGAVTSSVAALNVVSAPQALYDGFNYTVGANLTGQQNPTTFQTWALASGTAAKIDGANLSYAGLATSTGNRITWTSASMSQRLPIGTNVSGTLYFSFLLNIADVGSISGIAETIAGFGADQTSTAFSSKINISSNSFQTYQLGLYKGGGTGTGAIAPNLFSTNDVVFVVGNYTFNSGANNDDTCNMWLNPDPATFGTDTPPTPTVGPIGVAAGTDISQISVFFFRATTAPPRKYADELRIGYSWAEVTPPAVPTLSITQSTTNAVISWPNFVSTDFLLQSATNLPGPWTGVTNPVVPAGTNYTVTVPLKNSSARFFRLSK